MNGKDGVSERALVQLTMEATEVRGLVLDAKEPMALSEPYDHTLGAERIRNAGTGGICLGGSGLHALCSWAAPSQRAEARARGMLHSRR